MEDRLDKQAQHGEEKGLAQDAMIGGGLVIGGGLWQAGANITNAITDKITGNDAPSPPPPAAPPSDTKE